LTGCEYDITNGCESNYLDVSAPDLVMDKNGYYHMEWIEGYNQTFTTLNAEIGSNHIYRVYWDTDSYMNWNGEIVKPINHYSYTDDGVAHTVLGPWSVMIGDTMKVYTTYEDDCGIEYFDLIEVILENNE
jgi:hypothetical protein